jgi:hypothetical protein
MSNPLVFIADSVKVITELAEIFGLNKPRQNLDPTIQNWYKICQAEIDRLPRPLREEDPIKVTIQFIKYKIGAFVAIGQDTPIPDTPFDIGGDKPSVLIGGRWMVYVQRYILEGPRKWEFLSSLKHVKSALPRPGPAMAKAAELETAEKLTTEPPEYNENEQRTKKFIIHELRRTVKELFRGHKFTPQHQMRNFFPSTNSNYINSRSKLGALASSAGLIDVMKLRNRDNDHRIIFRKVDNDHDEIMREDEPQFKVIYDDSRLQEKYQILMHTMKDLALREVAEVKTVGLEEALKVRVITAGPPYTYTVLKSLQKFCHDILRKHPIFQLLGVPDPTEEMLYSQQLDYLKEGEALNSGDYKDATNEMYSWVSEIVAKQLAKEISLDDDTKELMLKALIGHVFNGRDQLHGSLMGSIINFIILCISNCALCRAAMEDSEQREIPLTDARLLINGDDCLFPIKERSIHYWAYLGGVMGLKVNKAKSFWSRSFCNINSRDFTLKQSRVAADEYHFTKVKFVNVGLLYGMKRSETSGVAMIADPKLTLGARARTLINDAPFDIQPILMSKFIEHHPQLFDTLLPWHIPEWAGGIGLPDVITQYSDMPEEPWKEVKYQRDLGGLKHLLLNWKSEQPRALHDAAMLDVHTYVEERLRPYVTELKSGVGVVGKRNDNIYDTLYKLLCVEWMFDYDHDSSYLRNLLRPEEEPLTGTAMTALRHNEKLWGKILNLPNLPKPDARTWDMFKSHMKRTEFIMGERGEIFKESI